MAFHDKYDATPFNGSDPFDARAEVGRQFITGAFLDAMDKIKTETPHDIHALAGGFLVGIVQIQMSMMHPTDSNHHELRAGLAKMLPWAIDLTRDMQGLQPLPSV